MGQARTKRERWVGVGGTLKKLVPSPTGLRTSIIFKIIVLPGKILRVTVFYFLN